MHDPRRIHILRRITASAEQHRSRILPGWPLRNSHTDPCGPRRSRAEWSSHSINTSLWHRLRESPQGIGIMEKTRRQPGYPQSSPMVLANNSQSSIFDAGLHQPQNSELTRRSVCARFRQTRRHVNDTHSGRARDTELAFLAVRRVPSIGDRAEQASEGAVPPTLFSFDPATLFGAGFQLPQQDSRHRQLQVC